MGDGVTAIKKSPIPQSYYTQNDGNAIVTPTGVSVIYGRGDCVTSGDQSSRLLAYLTKKKYFLKSIKNVYLESWKLRQNQSQVSLLHLALKPTYQEDSTDAYIFIG